MLRREKLLEDLESMIAVKRNLIPMLDKYISSTLSFSDLSKKDQQAMADQFRKYAVLQNKHMELMKDIVARVHREAVDVY